MLSNKLIRNLQEKFSSWGEAISPKTRKIFWGLLFLLVLSLILTIDLIPRNLDLKVGQVSKTDITAPRTMTFIDEEKTEQLRQIAARSAPRVYEEDPNVINVTKDKINDFFTTLKNWDKPAAEGNTGSEDIKSHNLEQLVIKFKDKYGKEINEDTIILLYKASPETKESLRKAALDLMMSKFQQRILPDDLAKVKDELAQDTMKLDLPREYRLALADILENMAKPNMILNKEATQKRQEEAMSKIEPVKRTVRQGEVIVRKGDVVSEDDIKVLEALGLQKPRVNYLNIIGIIITIITIVLMANLYFMKNKPKFWCDQKKIIYLELMVIVIMVMAKIVDFFQVQAEYLAYMVPVAMASILTTVLISTDIAVMLTVFLSFLIALVFDNSFNIALTSFIGGIVGIFSVYRVNQRNDLVRAGFNVSGILVVLILGLTLMRPFGNWIVILWSVLMGVLNGVLVAILANGLLPYLENTFGLTSSVKLLELSNPSQPILKRLLVEAPGTYHHSVIVGNLAETAADDIGANSLLARVGAYYHDIGKIKRPYFFTDNQFGGENPHDKLSANLSSLIIKSHVKDGVEMARENRLPESIVDIIKEHHGTNLISYFYQQALKDSKHDSVEESDFRYDGPKPQSKEAAIIMLADIVEAALRSKQFNRGNQNRIEGLVRELVRDKLTEGQLDESDLTLKDLDAIVNSFVKVLTGIYHQRIDYPEKLLKEMKRADRSDQDRNK